MCKTGCETGCLTVCTSHKDSLLSDNTLLTNAKIGLHTPWTWFVTCRFSVCFNIERPVWWNQVRLLTFFAPWPQWLMPRHTSSSRYSSSWLDAFFLFFFLKCGMGGTPYRIKSKYPEISINYDHFFNTATAVFNCFVCLSFRLWPGTWCVFRHCTGQSCRLCSTSKAASSGRVFRGAC